MRSWRIHGRPLQESYRNNTLPQSRTPTKSYELPHPAGFSLSMLNSVPQASSRYLWRSARESRSTPARRPRRVGKNPFAMIASRLELSCRSFGTEAHSGGSCHRLDRAAGFRDQRKTPQTRARVGPTDSFEEAPADPPLCESYLPSPNIDRQRKPYTPV